MKKTFFAVMSILVLTGSLSAEVVEAVVARVGDRIITRTQYQTRLRLGFEEIESTVPPAEQSARKAEYQKELINEMLAEVLLKDRADRLGLTVSPQEIQNAVERLKSQYGLSSDEEFNDSLRRSGMSRAEMELRLRDTLLTNKVFSRELRSREELTDKELRERYDREREDYRLPERARLREIVLTVPEGADAATVAETEQKAQTIVSAARGGEDFASLVTQHSESPSKDQGGSIGLVAKGELIANLDEAVFAAAPGTVIGPVRTRAGFHIMSVDERLPSEVPAFESIKDRLRTEASEETFQRDYKAYIENLRKEAYVQVNVAQIPLGE